MKLEKKAGNSYWPALVIGIFCWALGSHINIAAAVESAPLSATQAAADDLSEPAPEMEETAPALSSATLIGKIVAYVSSTGENGSRKQTFGPGVYLANAGQMSEVGNDQTGLLELGPAMRVHACQHEILTGNTCENFENLTGANKAIPIGAGISRLDVRPLVVGYRARDFSGVAQGFEIGRHEVSNGDFAQVGNDKIRSLRIAPGLSVRICTDNPETTTGGTCATFTRSAASIPGSLDGNASWMEVRPVTVAYRGARFVGTNQRFPAGVFTASQLSVVGNDMISSLLVNEGVATRICSDNPNTTVGGTCGTFANSALTLPSSLDERTSWMENRHTVILQPLNDVRLGGDEVTLRGYATDAQGNELPGNRLRWFSSRDGFLGTGNVLAVHLSTEDSACGSGGALGAQHVISLVATNSRGIEMTTKRVYGIYIVC